MRLAVLPASGSDAQRAAGILQDVSERISHMKNGASLVEVITPTEAARIQIATPEQAQQAHATYALTTSLSRDGADLVVQVSLVDLKTLSPVRHFSNPYSEAAFGAIPAAIAGTVSDALDLQGNAKSDGLSLAATAPYDQGLQARSSAEAINCFEEAARLDPRSPLPVAQLVETEVMAYNETKDASLLVQAKSHLLAAQRLNPDSISVHFATGRMDEATGDYEKARAEYVRASELEPRNIKALELAAGMYEKLDDPDKAVQTLKAAIGIDPTFYRPYRHLGAFYYNRGQYVEAAEQFRKVIERAPQDILAYTNLAASLEEIGQYAPAEQALSTALKIKVTADGLNNMGNLLVFERRDADAVSYYERAHSLSPMSFLYLLNLADANRRLGHTSVAKGQYRQGMDLALAELRQNPRVPGVRASVAYFAARLGLSERAQDEIKQALQLSPSDNQVIKIAVLTYEALGLRESALAVLDAATSQTKSELISEPDLADFSKDSHFKDVVVTPKQGDKK